MTLVKILLFMTYLRCHLFYSPQTESSSLRRFLATWPNCIIFRLAGPLEHRQIVLVSNCKPCLFVLLVFIQSECQARGGQNGEIVHFLQRREHPRQATRCVQRLRDDGEDSSAFVGEVGGNLRQASKRNQHVRGCNKCQLEG